MTSKPTYIELRDTLQAAIRTIELLQASATAEAVASVQPRLARFKEVLEWSGALRKRRVPGNNKNNGNNGNETTPTPAPPDPAGRADAAD